MGDYTGKLSREGEAARAGVALAEQHTEKLRLAKATIDEAIRAEATRTMTATAEWEAPPTTASAIATEQVKPPTSRSLLDIVESDCALLAKKQADYANGSDPWLNFRESAEFVSRVRGVKVNALDVAYMLLGLKVSRLRNLGTRVPSNESRLDTLQDLRGYSAIIQAMEEETHG